MRIITIIFLIFSTIVTTAQTPEIDWQNTIGGAGMDRHSVTSATSDGGYILGGISSSNISGDKTEDNNGILDYWVVKLNAMGDIEWQNSIGGDTYNNLWSIRQTSDGGYILAGSSSSNMYADKTEDAIGPPGTFDYWIVKLGPTGDVLWDNTIGANGWDFGYVVRETADNGYILGGSSNSDATGDKTENSLGDYDYWILKLDSSGNILWQNTIGGNDEEFLTDIALSMDGGYLLSGSSWSDISGDKTENSKGSTDYWIVKINMNGEVVWDKTIGGDNSDECYSVIPTNDNGYLLTGHSGSGISGDKTEPNYGESLDIWILKIDNSGNILWQNTIGGTGDEYMESPNTAIQTQDGGFLLGVSSASDAGVDKSEDSRGSFDYWIIKTDLNGVVQWDKTIGGDQIDYARSIVESADGSYAISGRSVSSLSGDKTEESQGLYDYWIVHLSPSLGIYDSSLENSIILYPNPATNKLWINVGERQIESLLIYSENGQIINRLDEFDSKLSIDVSYLASGIYFVEFFSDGKSAIKKFVKN